MTHKIFIFLVLLVVSIFAVAPSITFISQSPANITTTNLLHNNLTIIYNISNTTSTPMIFYKTNNSEYDGSIYINGTLYTGFEHKSCINLSSTLTYPITWECILERDNIYPGTYDINQSYFKTSSLLNYGLNNQDSYIRINLYNVSNIKNYSYVDAIVSNATFSPQPLKLYYCNSTYQTGIVTDNSNCILYAEVPTTNQSSYFSTLIGLNQTTGMIGTVAVTPNSSILIRGSNVGIWEGQYISNITRIRNFQGSTNNGNTWSNLTGTANVHIRQFGDYDTLFYLMSAAPDNESWSIENATNSSVEYDNMEWGNLPPSHPLILTPTTTNYYKNSTLSITYTNSISPNSYPIYYNISLLDENYTFKQTIIGNNFDNLSYVWNISSIDYGKYFIQIKAVDSLNQTSYSYSNPFYISPIINFTSPTPLQDSINYDYGMIFNFTSELPMGIGNYISIDRINYSCSKSINNLSCSYTLTYDEYKYNNTYNITMYANISGVIYKGDSRTFDYYGCGRILRDSNLFQNYSLNLTSTSCFTVENGTLNGQGYTLFGGPSVSPMPLIYYYPTGYNVTIENIIINRTQYGSSVFGIKYGGSVSKLILKNVTLTSSILNSYLFDALNSGPGTGTVIINQSTFILTENVKGMRIDSQSAGIYVENSTFILLGKDSIGISELDVHDLWFYNNTIYNLTSNTTSAFKALSNSYRCWNLCRIYNNNVVARDSFAISGSSGSGYYTYNFLIYNNTLNGNFAVATSYGTIGNISNNTIIGNHTILGYTNTGTYYTNNIFNTTYVIINGTEAKFNLTKVSGTNIIGGPYLGGNYWKPYTGKDFNGDGIGDTPFIPVVGEGVDYLPLVLSGDIGIVYFSSPTPQNNTIYTSTLFTINITTNDLIISLNQSLIEIDGENKTCTLSMDKKSCSYTLNYDELIYNHTYSIIGYINISGDYYATNETRVIPYYGCGKILSNSSLNNNITNSGNTCFTLKENNTQFECNGFSIIGTFGNGIDIQSNDNIIQNCSINGFTKGFYINSTSNNTIKTSIITNNTYGLETSNSSSTEETSIFFKNNFDIVINQSSIINFTNITITNPSGTYENYSIVDIIDNTTTESYYINWTLDLNPPIISYYFTLQNKIIKIQNISGNPSVDLLILKWNISEISPYPLVYEKKLNILKYDMAWLSLNSTPDTTNHELIISNLSSYGGIGLFFYNDTTGQNITLNSPQNDTYSNSTTQDFNFTAIDIDDSTFSCSLNLNGIMNETNTTVINNTPSIFSILGMSEGYHYWNVNCSDEVGNGNISLTYNITIDTTPPIISLLNPEDNYNQSANRTVTFKFNASDTLSSILNCSILIDDMITATNSSTNISTNTTFEITDIDYGSHNWTILCYDEALNGAYSSTRNFTMDYLITLTWSSPTPTNSTTLNTYPIIFNFTSSLPITSCILNINSQNHTGTLTSDNYSCSYEMLFSEHFLNENYSARGYAIYNASEFITDDIQFGYYGCGLLNSSINLTNNIQDSTNDTTDCIVFNQNSIELNCRGYSISSLKVQNGINTNTKTGLTIKNCIISSLNNSGIYIGVGTTTSNISNNTISNSYYGIYSIGSSLNNIYNNEFDSNQYGIYMDSGTSANLIYNNKIETSILNNSYDLASNDWNLPVKNCTVANILGGACKGGNYYSDYTGNDSNADGIGDQNYSIPGGANIDTLPLTTNYIVPIIDHCQDIISSNVTYLVRNFSANKDYCIGIFAENITLNGQSHYSIFEGSYNYLFNVNGSGYNFIVNNFTIVNATTVFYAVNNTLLNNISFSGITLQSPKTSASWYGSGTIYNKTLTFPMYERIVFDGSLYNVTLDYGGSTPTIDAITSRAKFLNCSSIPSDPVDWYGRSDCVNISGFIGTLHVYYSDSVNETSFSLFNYQSTYAGNSNWQWRTSSKNATENYLTYSMTTSDDGLYQIFEPYNLVNCHLSYPPIKYVFFSPSFGTATNATNISPTGQTSINPLFNCTNYNAVSFNISLRVNQSYANVTDFCSTAANFSNLTILNTSEQIIQALDSGNNSGIWCMRNYTAIPSPSTVINYVLNYTE